MRWSWLFALVILLHGGIHVLGFLAASGIAQVPQLSGRPTFAISDFPVGHPVLIAFGAMWLVAFIGFAATAIGVVADQGWWQALAAASTVISIMLVVLWWDDAKFGILPNLAIIGVLAWTAWQAQAAP